MPFAVLRAGVHHRAGTQKSHWAGGNSTRNRGCASMDGKCISLRATMSVRRQLISILPDKGHVSRVCVTPGDWRQTPLRYVRRQNGDVWSALSIFVRNPHHILLYTPWMDRISQLLMFAESARQIEAFRAFNCNFTYIVGTVARRDAPKLHHAWSHIGRAFKPGDWSFNKP